MNGHSLGRTFYTKSVLVKPSAPIGHEPQDAEAHPIVDFGAVLRGESADRDQIWVGIAWKGSNEGFIVS